MKLSGCCGCPPQLGRVFGDEYRGVAERGAHLRGTHPARRSRKAEGVMSADLSRGKQFRVLQYVANLDDSDEVLRFVIGWAKALTVDQSPVCNVANTWRNHRQNGLARHST